MCTLLTACALLDGGRYRDAVRYSSSDGARAVESARLESLKAHVAGLQAMQAQCKAAAERAKRHAASLGAKLTAAQEELSRQKLEISRLRMALAHGHVVRAARGDPTPMPPAL